MRYKNVFRIHWLKGLDFLRFEEEYFSDSRYFDREALITNQAENVLKWASKVARFDFLFGVGKKALDGGCAYGFASQVLSRLGYETYSVDISRFGLQRAKTYAKEVGHALCDVQSGLPLKRNSLDLIVCFEVLEHLRDPVVSLKNMFECCRGTVVATTPNRSAETIKSLMRDFDETHVSVFTPAEWEELNRENLDASFVKVESYVDANLKAADRLLWSRSFRVPYFGLNTRILVQR